jgi:hypothetical protein
VNKPDFRPLYDDCMETGNKHTESNCGLCNDDFFDRDMDLHPEQFRRFRTPKYQLDHHKCPMDLRANGPFGFGCFYDCYLFSNRMPTPEKIKEMVQKIREMVDARIMESGA